MTQVDGKTAVESFLLKVHKILQLKNFDLSKNFTFVVERKNYSKNHKYTNRDTLIELGYSSQDVIQEIKTLTVKHYKETLEDNLEYSKNSLYCFIKTIQGRQVYIKIKINEFFDNNVVCLSFHFAEHLVEESQLPYSKD